MGNPNLNNEKDSLTAVDKEFENNIRPSGGARTASASPAYLTVEEQCPLRSLSPYFSKMTISFHFLYYHHTYAKMV